jgi:formylglycine-generating enzyme required for sulfatase activity
MRGLLVASVLLCAANGCLVDERCQSADDCPSPKVCNASGKCVWECSASDDCGVGFGCEGHLCVPVRAAGITCPAEMEPVNNIFCMDRFEASRSDATAVDVGVDDGIATSRPGVLPWRLDDNNALAEAACKAVGKRLCSSFEWELACRGPEMTTYGYGNTYDGAICNGIDTFGPDDVKLLPTGELEGCVNGWGLYDINGNLWEHVAGGSGITVRGGAYNCIDSMSLHRCDYVPVTWVPSALGFRCCLSPDGSSPDADIREQPDVGTPDVKHDGSGCLDPDVKIDPEAVVEVKPECVEDEDCQHLLAEGQQCVEAVCLEGACSLPALDGTECSDPDPCTVGDICVTGQCEPGVDALECDDQNLCTDDECIVGNGCQYSPNSSICDDEDPCTLGDVCSEGDCTSGPGAPVCEDDNPCTDDSCIALLGCTNTPNSEPCSDANPCTDPDLCVDGSCVSGPVICDCETDGDCPVDDDLCNGQLICDQEVFPHLCVVADGSVVTCEASQDVCKKNVCDPIDGQCKLTPVANGKPCDDLSDCTTEDTCQGGVCEGAGNICECSDTGDCVMYDDGNPCNGVFWCNTTAFPYKCELLPGSVVVCPPPSAPCTEVNCNPVSGLCEESPVADGTACDDGNACNGADKCAGGGCVSGAEDLCLCPEDMVPVNSEYCLDRYEASKPDATGTFQGFDGSQAMSQAGVIPWFPVEHAQAKTACEAAGKRLCTEAEILLACSGTNGTMYHYGDEYSATICNGIDAFCLCENEQCADVDVCPYPHCYNMSIDGVYGEGCGAAFHVAPTGFFQQCVNEWGAYDINGNVWELVDTGTGESWWKGGAYNCGNSEYLHQCIGMFQNISAKGFRCCLNIAD